MPISTVVAPDGQLVQVLRVGRGAAVSVGSTGTHGTATSYSTDTIRFCANIGIMWYVGSPTDTLATTDGNFLPANTPEFTRVIPNQTVLLARTTTGTATGVLGTLWLGEAI